MDTDAIRNQTMAVDAAAKAVAATRVQIAKVSAKGCGQDTCSILVAGVTFSLTELNRSYMPEVVNGMEAIQREVLAILQAQLASQISRLEGAEWKLRQLIKAT